MRLLACDVGESLGWGLVSNEWRAAMRMDAGLDIGGKRTAICVDRGQGFQESSDRRVRNRILARRRIGGLVEFLPAGWRRQLDAERARQATRLIAQRALQPHQLIARAQRL